ncbi:hypothetical protein J5N97_005388 [Dioscorea zingiberensis]|uniref:Serine-threonine/tyrosine-protein kinase catalytic domain-containing protein n=1 Tax=Dioscorea zingiberensis TaxID=325984 RepID=A0A9D5HT16_9LILI|nr:hypothetical protein J5N97_005388 [Dioscorea zingiberensis]
MWCFSYIHEYLSNGSLGDSLCNLESPLELTVRMHIALGAAQEQGCSKKATEQMDVYSFGVVLLELITGRKAEMPEPRESIDIVTWVRRKINMTNATHQILDPNISNSFQQEMLGVLELALRCISVVPDKRPKMDEVVQSLLSVYTTVQSLRIVSGETSISSEH